MKSKIGICGILFLMAACGSGKRSDTKINQQLNTKKDKEIVLVTVSNDSRCPEGTQCIWAGEVVFEIAAYENKKQVEQVKFTLNAATAEEIKVWFNEHLPKNTKELQSVQVLPYPKEGVSIRPEDYYIKLVY